MKARKANKIQTISYAHIATPITTSTTTTYTHISTSVAIPLDCVTEQSCPIEQIVT